MLWVTVTIFAFTYAGVALGGIRGLALDRTGFALLGAIAMVAVGRLSVAEAWRAIDAPTILLLYSLMIVSAQFRLGGAYTALAARLSRAAESPHLMLAALIVTSAVLSAVLANDIVCLAFTPVLVVALRRAGRNPVPFLLALAAASNVGSAATIIGNPQNMLIGQLGRLDFGSFLWWCGPPALAGLVVIYAVISRLYRGKWDATDGAAAAATIEVPAATEAGAIDPDRATFGRGWPRFDRLQTTKGVVLTAALIVLFFTPVPREASALAVAGLLLLSRKQHSREVLGLVDWHLITLFCGLFVVIRGLEATGLPARAMTLLAPGLGSSLNGAGAAAGTGGLTGAGGFGGPGSPGGLAGPGGFGGNGGLGPAATALFGGVTVVLSNIVSNVPAVMLLVPRLTVGVAQPWYVLALASTLAGNLVLVGSIANLIVVEQARAGGVKISFLEHLRAGVPITLGTLAIAWGWVVWLGR